MFAHENDNFDEDFGSVDLEHPLEGIWAKIARAEENTLRLEEDLNAFFIENPEPIITTGFASDRLPKYFVRARLRSRLPLALSVDAGAIVHQFRSSLDHLVVALAVQNGTEPTRKHEFPIYMKAKDFKDAIKKKLDGLSDLAIAAIEGAQPYHVKDSNMSTIKLLHSLNNRDKHRELVTVALAASMPEQITIGSSHPLNIGADLVGISGPKAVPLSIKDADVITFTLSEPDPYFLFEGKLKLEMVIVGPGKGDTMPIIQCLDLLSAFTRQMVGKLSSHFP